MLKALKKLRLYKVALWPLKALTHCSARNIFRCPLRDGRREAGGRAN